MRVGVAFFPTDQSIQPVPLAEALEHHGFESLWLTEHSHIPASRATPRGGVEGAPPLPEEYWRTLDQFVSLGAVAARTERLRLGTGVTLVAQRDPIWLAKQVATVDLLSGGRFHFGIGYGWNKEEMAHHGVAYGERRALLAEKIGLMKALWTQDEAAYDGELLHLEPSWAWPKPVQKPHPPIHMGSAAGPKTFAAMASFCDGWMPIVARHDVESKLDALGEALAAEGRDLEDFDLTAFSAPVDPKRWDELERLGFDRVLIMLPSAPADVVLPLLDEYAALIDR